MRMKLTSMVAAVVLVMAGGARGQATKPAASKPADGSTTLRLRVENRSESPVSFLSRTDRNLFRFVDAEGHDLSDTLDPYSVDADLLRVEPGTAATGALRLKSEAAPGPAVGLTLRESGGEGREFSLTGQAL